MQEDDVNILIPAFKPLIGLTLSPTAGNRVSQWEQNPTYCIWINEMWAAIQRSGIRLGVCGICTVVIFIVIKRTCHPAQQCGSLMVVTAQGNTTSVFGFGFYYGMC